jgi:hypothetical protein
MKPKPNRAKQLQRRYTRVVKACDKWNTFLQIDHQGFYVVAQTSKREAQWFARMLGIALARLVEKEKANQ